MNNRNPIWLSGAVALVVVSVAGVLFLNRSHTPPPPELGASPPSETVGPIAPVAEQASPQPTQTAVVAPAAPRHENIVPETGGPPEKVVRMKPEQTLATVNGVAITLKDLIPLPKEKAATEQMLSAEMYDFLFNRAVERELTFQSARALGVELTEQQKARLAEIRVRSEKKAPEVFDTVQQSPENVEFEQRDFTGLLLQGSLAEKAGVPSPHVTPELVEAYYQQHKSDYPQLPDDPARRSPEAWQPVDAAIRTALAPVLQAAHDEAIAKFVEGLKAKANIVVAQQGQ